MTKKVFYVPLPRKRGVQLLEKIMKQHLNDPLIKQVLTPDLIEWLKNHPDENPDIFGRMRQAEADLHTLDEMIDIPAVLDGDIDCT